MHTPSLPIASEDWSLPRYTVRVRATMYLWGSAGVTKDITFEKPLLLHIRNDVFGEPIMFGTKVAGAQTILGNLLPGECVSIPMQGVSGVFATCALESTVDCVIKE